MPIVLIYFRFSWDVRVWKFFLDVFMNSFRGWSGVTRWVWKNIVTVLIFLKVVDSSIHNLAVLPAMITETSLPSLTIEPKNLFSRKTDYLAEEFSFQFLLFQWKFSIQKSLLQAILKDFPVFWTLKCKLFFFSHSRRVWLLCFQQSIQFSPHFPREKVLIEKWNEISREADAEMIELKIVI